MKQKLVLALAITATTWMLASPKFVQAQISDNQLQITRIADLQRPRGIEISGRVQSVVGNKFTLDDGTGQIIVDAGLSHWRQINLNQGEQVTVTGELSKSGREFNAFNIRR